MEGNRYSIDTSVLIDLQRNYQHVENLINLFRTNFTNKNFFISKYVLDELKNKEENFFINFEDDEYSGCIIDLNEDVQQAIQKIDSRVPGYIDHQPTKNKADPFVVAVALVLNAKVLTQERYNNNDNEEYRRNNPGKLKIPNICRTFNIECKDLVMFLSDLIQNDN